MKRFFYIALSLLMIPFFHGCVQDTTVIHVKPDGSGTIEETTLFSNSMLELMESFSDSMAVSETPKDDQAKKDMAKIEPLTGKERTRDDLLAKMVKDAEMRAATFGKAVTFISAKPVKAESGSGYTALYAFQDINLVKVNQNPSDKVDGQKAEKSESPPKEEFLLFQFTKGSPAKLVISFPSQKDIVGDAPIPPDTPKADADSTRRGEDPQATEMMKNLFQDMKVKISLHCEGAIITTNATYREDSTVTLIEMDFGKIMSNAALLHKLNTVKPQSMEETKALLKNVEGLKIEANNPVTIEFK
jgi:hypothetical protein